MKIMRWYPILWVWVASVIFASDIDRKEFLEDKKHLEKIEKRLRYLEDQIDKGNTSREVLGELNSLGHPLYMMKEKYMLSEKHGKFYRRVNEDYEKLMLLKRKVFPSLLEKEARQVKAGVCEIKAEGKDMRTIHVKMKDPEDEKKVLRLLTDTQLGSAHLIGVEEIKFSKCN